MQHSWENSVPAKGWPAVKQVEVQASMVLGTDSWTSLRALPLTLSL
jgi:hypothetical protein